MGHPLVRGVSDQMISPDAVNTHKSTKIMHRRAAGFACYRVDIEFLLPHSPHLKAPPLPRRRQLCRSPNERCADRRGSVGDQAARCALLIKLELIDDLWRLRS